MYHCLEAQHHLMLLDESLQAVDEAQVVVDELEVEGREPFIDERCVLLLALLFVVLTGMYLLLGRLDEVEQYGLDALQWIARLGERVKEEVQELSFRLIRPKILGEDEETLTLADMLHKACSLGGVCRDQSLAQ